jgi:iron complex transport system permease protein
MVRPAYNVTMNSSHDTLVLEPRVSKKSSVQPRFVVLLAICLALLCCSIIASTCIGPIPISPLFVLKTVIAPNWQPQHGEYWTIIWQVRLPRIVLAGIVGTALAVSGAGFQSLLRNDLADPYILGISSGASAAVAVVTLFGLNSAVAYYVDPAAGFLGALGVLILVIALSSHHRSVDTRSLLLNGVIVSAFLWALEMAALRLIGYDFEQILNWLMGSLAAANWLVCGILFFTTLVCSAALWLRSPSMNLYAVGEESARQLGLDAERFKLIVVVASTILAAAAVSSVGIIGFIGLISPHIARRLLRSPDHRFTIPIAAIVGAILLIWSDTCARVFLGGDILPVGIITAFLGAPFFCYQLRRR